jgi:hypothetical protein
MQDVMILLWNCPECTQLKMKINFQIAFTDETIGKNGQKLFAYYAFSNTGFGYLRDTFKLSKDCNAPLIIRHDGEVIKELPKMIEYINTNY